MEELFDREIRQSLKNWAVQQQPPSNLRTRLLLMAASTHWESYSSDLGMLTKGGSLSVSESPSDQAMRLHNLPWLWVLHLNLNPIRRIS